jgi:hypothetical protein
MEDLHSRNLMTGSRCLVEWSIKHTFPPKLTTEQVGVLTQVKNRVCHAATGEGREVTEPEIRAALVERIKTLVD